MALPSVALGAIAGRLDFDYSTFLYSSNLRPSSSLTVGANLRVDTGTSTVARLDLGVLTLSDSFESAVTPNLREGYVGLRSEAGRDLALLGRKRVEWSRADEVWELGEWSPRFVGDPLHPELIGKTGAFYIHEEEGFFLALQASPIGIPERGFPIVAQNGKLTAYSPFWTPPATLAIYSGQGFPLNYSIEYPQAAKDFLLRPNASVMARVSVGGGSWLSAGYSFGPMQKAVIGVEPHLGLDELPSINATIHPRFPFRHVGALEFGLDREFGSFWSSLARDVPIQEGLPSNWYMFPYGAAWIGAAGGTVKINRDFKLFASGILVQEGLAPVPKYLNSIPWVSRFGYERASRVGIAAERAEWRLAGRAEWVHDYRAQNDLASCDLDYRLGGIGVGLGVDFLLTQNDQGFIGQYLGSDRLRWKVNYAF